MNFNSQIGNFLKQYELLLIKVVLLHVMMLDEFVLLAIDGLVNELGKYLLVRILQPFIQEFVCVYEYKLFNVCYCCHKIVHFKLLS